VKGASPALGEWLRSTLPPVTELAAGNELAADRVVDTPAGRRRATAAPRRFRQKQNLD
jgi:hypothetical protein